MDEATSYDYMEAVNPSLECAICRTAYISPVMSPACQHIFCHLCVVRAIELSPTCPIDRSPMQLEDLIEAPRIIQQLVEELQVFCPNRDRGCEVQCERGLLEGHLRDECSGRQREDIKGKGKAVASDAAGDASVRGEEEWLRCELCLEKLRIEDQEAHSTSCSTTPTTCPHCQTTLLRSSIPSHNLDCPSIPVPCPHAHHGCPARLPRSAMLEDHLEVSCAYEPIKDYLNRQEARLVEVEGENKLLATRCSGLEEGMKEMRSMLEAIRQGMGGFYVEPSRELLLVEAARPRTVQQFSTQSTQADASREGATWPTGEPSADRPSAFAPSPPTADTHLSPHLPSPFALPHPHEYRNSPTSPADHFPFPPPSASPPLSSTSSQQPLSAVLASLQSSIVSLSASIAAREARQSTNLMNETLRMQDDVQSVRAVVHGMRIQMHYLLMEVGRVTGSGGGGVGAGARGGLGGGAGVHPSSSNSVESTSDDEQGHGGPMMGMGMGMGIGMGAGGPAYYSQGGAPPRYFLPGGGPPMRGGGGAGPLLYPMGGMKL